MIQRTTDAFQDLAGRLADAPPRPWRLFTVVLVAVFLVETAVMLALTMFPPYPGLDVKHALADALLLTLVLAPLLHLFLFWPASLYIRKLKERERALASRALRASEQRLADIASASGDWFWEVDDQGRYTYASQAVEQVLGHAPSEMIGRHFWDSFHPEDRDSLLAEAGDLLASGRELWDFRNRNLTRDGETVILETRGVPVVDQEGRITGYRGVDRDVTERHRTQVELAKRNRILEAVTTAQTRFLAGQDQGALFDDLLEILLDITDSAYGFIGEVFEDPDTGLPYLRAHAFTNLAWTEELEDYVARQGPSGLAFTGLNTLYGAVLVSREPVIADEPCRDARAAGLPPGHPGLDSFMGLPLFSGETMVGMVGAANRPGGYDTNMPRLLAPFLTTCGQIIRGLRQETMRVSIQQALRESEALMRGVLEAAVDGVITINHQGRIQSFNPAAETIFGYQAWETIGRDVEMLMPLEYRARHHEVFEKRLADPDISRVLGTTREVEGLRKDGSVFPMDLSISLVRVEDKVLFSGIVRDISYRKRIEQLKKEFISTVSHELRTPLTSIHGSLGLLGGGAAGDLPEPAVSLVSIAHANTERLIHLINDILDMEKIESGRLDFEFQELDLAALAGQSLEANAGYAAKYDTSFVLTAPAVPVRLLGDPARLMQVMNNLLSNAAKFSPPGLEVLVVVARDGENPDRAVVSVTDQGPGVPPEFQDRIFQKFAQADASDTRQKSGTGLGLAIAKAIVERHRGRIGYRSAPGAGTTFFFELPLPGTRHELASHEPQEP